jgi:rhodanese-related sulfurtransferase
MKKTILLICFILFIFRLAAQTPDTLKFEQLEPVRFREEIQIANNPVLVDVREYFEYKKSRIRNAVNIPSSGNLEYSADTIAKNSNLFIYCTSGFRSNRVAKLFAEKDFVNVFSLAGGITAWKKEGMPVDKRKIKQISQKRLKD